MRTASRVACLLCPPGEYFLWRELSDRFSSPAVLHLLRFQRFPCPFTFAIQEMRYSLQYRLAFPSISDHYRNCRVPFEVLVAGCSFVNSHVERPFDSDHVDRGEMGFSFGFYRSCQNQDMTVGQVKNLLSCQWILTIHLLRMRTRLG